MIRNVGRNENSNEMDSDKGTHLSSMSKKVPEWYYLPRNLNEKSIVGTLNRLFCLRD